MSGSCNVVLLKCWVANLVVVIWPAHTVTVRLSRMFDLQRLASIRYCCRMRFELNSMRPRITVVMLIFTLARTAAVAQEDQNVRIRQEMDKLAPLVGKWNATWKFHHDGEIIERVGTDSISFVLDNTYLQWKVERHPLGEHKVGRGMSGLVLSAFGLSAPQFVEVVRNAGKDDDIVGRLWSAAPVAPEALSERLRQVTVADVPPDLRPEFERCMAQTSPPIGMFLISWMPMIRHLLTEDLTPIFRRWQLEDRRW